MRPGDYFGALFLTVLFAVALGIVAGLWLAVWLATNAFHQAAPTFPTFAP